MPADKSSPLSDESLYAGFIEDHDWHDHERSTMTTPNSNGSLMAAAQNADVAQISVGQRMLSATGGSILTSLLVTPLDVVRIRLQSQILPVYNTSGPGFNAHTTNAFKQLPADLGVTACCREVFWVANSPEVCLVEQGTVTRAIDCAVEDTQQRKFNSTLDGIRKIARNEGVLTLWRGLVPTLVMTIPANVIYLAGYEWMRVDPRSPIRRMVSDSFVPLVAGSVARIAAASVISPVEMFRTRLQATPGTGTGHFRATLEGLYQMTQARGYSSLWRGLGLTMWRDVPFSGLYWWGYEAVRNGLTDLRESNSIQDGQHHHRRRRDSRSQQSSAATLMDSFIAGTVSGAVAALVTTPFDVGKTRQQVFRHSHEEVSGSAAAVTTSASKALHPEQLPMPRFLLHIFQHEGMAGLFRGWAARCLKVAPACAIMISSYEFGKKMAAGVNSRRHSEGDNL